MKDTIYRDDAIEAWDKLSKRGRTEFDQVLMTLPSADVVDVNEVTIHYKPYPSADDEVVKAVRDCRNCAYGRYNDHFDTWFCYNDCECKDWDLWKSNEVAQRKWIKTVDGNGWDDWYVLKCPFCGATIEDKHYHSWEYNFCPHCGERVKGGDNK